MVSDLILCHRSKNLSGKERLHKLRNGQHADVVELVPPRTAVNADHAFDLHSCRIRKATKRFIPSPIPTLGQLDLDGNDAGGGIRPPARGFNDKIHFHSGRCSIVGHGAVLPADLIVNTQFVIDQGLQRQSLPLSVCRVARQLEEKRGIEQVEPESARKLLLEPCALARPSRSEQEKGPVLILRSLLLRLKIQL
jgi:hypothetical protein